MNDMHKNLAAKKCNYCNKKVVETTDCDSCKVSYHPSCATRVEIPDNPGKYKCCIMDSRSEVNSLKTKEKSEKSSDKSVRTLEMDTKVVKSIIAESFQLYLNPMEQKLNKKFEDIEKAVQFMSNSFDEQKAKFDSILEEVRGLRKENMDLKLRLQAVESKLEAMEVKDRAANIIIAGVPKQPNLDSRKISERILEGLELQSKKTEIVECFRLNKDKDEGPILVKFSNTHIKVEVLKKIRKLKGIDTKKCGLQGDNKKIYLNEDLPVSRRNLFKKVREVKKNKGYKAAFCVNGVIYLKKHEHDPAVKIRCESDIESI